MRTDKEKGWRAMSSALELPKAQVHTINIEHAHRPCSTDKSENHRCQAQDIQGPRVGASGDKELTAVMAFRNGDSFQRVMARQKAKNDNIM